MTTIAIAPSRTTALPNQGFTILRVRLSPQVEKEIQACRWHPRCTRAWQEVQHGEAARRKEGRHPGGRRIRGGGAERAAQGAGGSGSRNRGRLALEASR